MCTCRRSGPPNAPCIRAHVSGGAAPGGGGGPSAAAASCLPHLPSAQPCKGAALAKAGLGLLHFSGYTQLLAREAAHLLCGSRQPALLPTPAPSPATETTQRRRWEQPSKHMQVHARIPACKFDKTRGLPRLLGGVQGAGPVREAGQGCGTRKPPCSALERPRSSQGSPGAPGNAQTQREGEAAGMGSGKRASRLERRRWRGGGGTARRPAWTAHPSFDSSIQSGVGHLHACTERQPRCQPPHGALESSTAARPGPRLGTRQLHRRACRPPHHTPVCSQRRAIRHHPLHALVSSGVLQRGWHTGRAPRNKNVEKKTNEMSAWVQGRVRRAGDTLDGKNRRGRGEVCARTGIRGRSWQEGPIGLGAHFGGIVFCE